MADILLRGVSQQNIDQLKWLAESRQLTPAELVSRLLDLLAALDRPDITPAVRSALVDAGLALA